MHAHRFSTFAKTITFALLLAVSLLLLLPARPAAAGVLAAAVSPVAAPSARAARSAAARSAADPSAPAARIATTDASSPPVQAATADPRALTTQAAAFDTAARIAAFDDSLYPDWCSDQNEDPADDCPDTFGDAPPDDSSPGDSPDNTPPSYPPPSAQPAPNEPPPPPSSGDDQSTPPDFPPDWMSPIEPAWPPTPDGLVAHVAADGRTAIAPKRAPRLVKNLIHAANRITDKPYKWGGGHARLVDSGYDCSGSTSYVLRAVGMVNGSMVSGGFETWGRKGAGRWVNVYANRNHVFMVIAGLRFDTSGAGESGPRWRTEPRGTRGFRLRHPAGF